jgi:cytochrome oxidase Cu insertion factor (SCO1/SenC/PrrC family)
VLALAVASSLVVVLALQKRDLVTRVETLTERIRHPYVGMYVPAVTLSAVTGDSVLLGGPPLGRVQVLFVFSTRCQYCKASLPAWKQIAAELAASERVEVVGVSLDSVDATRRYLGEHGIDLLVVSFTRIGALTETGAIDSIIRAVPVDSRTAQSTV